MSYIEDNYRYKEYQTKKDREKIDKSLTANTIKCKCGHSIVMSSADRTICSWCGCWVYRTKQIEFKYKLNEAIKKR